MAKRPGEDLAEALREARLYANELIASLLHGINPCVRVVASDGNTLVSSPVDQNEPDIKLDFADFHVGSVGLARLVDFLARPAALTVRDKLYDPLSSKRYYIASTFVGGQSVRNEQLAPNTFGSNLALDYRSIFNPISRKERVHIARNAYVTSRRREAYIGEIDRVIRKAIGVVVPDARLVEDTAEPSPIIQALRAGRRLENEIMILVGGVGCGKSTFVDYLSEVKLPPDVADATEWVRLNLNTAPDDSRMLENWMLDQLKEGLQNNYPSVDFPARETLDRVFSSELSDLARGPLARLDHDSEHFQTLLATKLMEWCEDRLKYTRALVRYLCHDKNTLLVVVFDNCDKRDRDAQLRAFEAARWLQTALQCLIILPIRDITYRLYDNVPPLDTKIKDLVFRIDPPSFSDVLYKRMELVLAELNSGGTEQQLSYYFPNGMRVVYPASEIGKYVASIFLSLYKYDKLIRGLLTGLAGRNIRLAMEMFIEFCRSGHIGEHEFLKIRQSNGEYTLRRDIVYRVLIRRSRRYYSGDESFVKNLFQCDPTDIAPDHLARAAVLTWLDRHFGISGPNGVEGFHAVRRIISDLAIFGHDADRLIAEVEYLVKEQCIITEHQRPTVESLDDLVALSPAGHVHVSLLSNPTYVAACAEDTWVADEELAKNVAERIGQYGPGTHYSRGVTAANCEDLLSYLREAAAKRYRKSADFCDPHYVNDSRSALDEIITGADKNLQKMPNATGWYRADARFEVGCEIEGQISRVEKYGVFVQLDDGPEGLAHVTGLPMRQITDEHFVGRRVLVSIGAALKGTPAEEGFDLFGSSSAAI